jgi:hypothetical protein
MPVLLSSSPLRICPVVTLLSTNLQQGIARSLFRSYIDLSLLISVDPSPCSLSSLSLYAPRSLQQPPPRLWRGKSVSARHVLCNPACVMALTQASLAAEVDAKIKADQVLKARELEGRGLEKRACRNNGCKCRPGTKQGSYCGLCDAVTDRGSDGWYTRDIFECNSSGGCCDYGTNSVCSGSNWSSFCPK